MDMLFPDDGASGHDSELDYCGSYVRTKVNALVTRSDSSLVSQPSAPQSR